MKQQRIVFIKKQKGQHIMGIGQMNADHLVDGMDIPIDRGGGKIASMTMQDGMICIRKDDKDGKPVRDFGSVNVAGGTKRTLIADGVMFPASLCAGILFRDEEAAEMLHGPVALEMEKESRAAIAAQDPPPAKPVQQQKR